MTKKRKSPPAILIRMSRSLIADVQRAADEVRISREGYCRQVLRETVLEWRSHKDRTIAKTRRKK